MRLIFFAGILYLLSSEKMNSQSYFKVVETQRYDLKEATDLQYSGKYYRIILARDSLPIYYPLHFPSDNFDTLKAIKELLTMEGDERLCSLPIMDYNPLRSQIYMGACKNYSIQVEALFLINQLVLRNPFLYSSCPVLVDRSTKEESSISGKIVKEAYQKYKEWVSKIENGSIRFDSEGDSFMPLFDSHIKWY
jgi:hypothetical protein